MFCVGIAGFTDVESRAFVDISDLTEIFPFALQDLDCTGNELRLLDCQFSTYLERACLGQSSSASVMCFLNG